MADGVQVQGLHQVALRATDLDASIAFYRDVLGLRYIARFDPPGLAFFDLGGVRLLLEAGSAGEAVLYYTVPDLDAACDALRAAGAPVAHEPALVHRDDDGTFGAPGEEEWMAFAHDPSGNILGLAQRRSA
jgi:methylmalonyl-CoA/ethylmalonyl-CoA epimerase